MSRGADALFAGHVGLRAVIDAVLEGHLGHVTADGDAARLSLGCYEIFGGDPSSPGARDLLAGAGRPRELVYGNDPSWRRLILEVHGGQVAHRPMLDFDAAGLDRAHLRQMERELPAKVVLRPMDLALSAQLDAELEPHALQVFASPADFVARGSGVAALSNGTLACAATSYAVSSRFVEVAIATRTAFRGLGLAAAASAAFMGRCLDEGRVPRWSASNPVSQRLAVRLGFRPAGVCEVLYLRAA